ncbi:cell division protein MraZ [Neisseria gonorrhoeae NG-k51.05]|nr:cell division protein MraZ [Neisseria gonorrhoeae NG-k51.05]
MVGNCGAKCLFYPCDFDFGLGHVMFGGAHELSIDSKGRLAVPAKFRDILSRLYTPAVVATLESKHKLLMYPVAEWEKVAAQLLNLKVADNPVLRRFQNLLLHNAEILEWDSAGRVLVPAGLRKRVDFDREVVLVGRANRLELWGREQWEAEMVQALDDDPDELAFQLSQTDLQL